MAIKKIGLVIPSLQAGGMERVMSELIREFSKDKSLELHLVLYGITREIFYDVPQNVKIHTPEFTFDNNKRLLYTFKTLLFLRKKLKSIQPATILSFGEIWNNFVLLATIGLHVPVFVSDRCQPNKSLGKLHDWLRNKLYPRAKGVIAQTEQGKQIFKAMYFNPNIEVIGNPIRLIESGEERQNIVLSVGRLIDSKHHDELIKLFAKINKPDWKLIIVGDDAIKQQNKIKLQQLIHELGVEDTIELAGKRNDVEAFYAKSKIFAFTSSSEGFPNVIGEAQSAGLATVAFDCVSGPSDMINDGENGFLIPLFDYAEFQKKLEILMANEELRNKMGKTAASDINRFSSEAIANQFLKFILN